MCFIVFFFKNRLSTVAQYANLCCEGAFSLALYVIGLCGSDAIGVALLSAAVALCGRQYLYSVGVQVFCVLQSNIASQYYRVISGFCASSMTLDDGYRGAWSSRKDFGIW